jgi:alkaline phosphatase
MSRVTTARNVILFIGDGMGEAQRTAARWTVAGYEEKLAMDTMPVLGWSRTRSANDPITDSAAAATALATGTRTNNGVIGLDPAFNRLPTILEHAQAEGMSVGLVTTVPLAHATPAAFVAKVEDRVSMPEIARQMLAARVDVLLGGGYNDFCPHEADREMVLHPSLNGWNGREEALAAGYTVIREGRELEGEACAASTRLLGLFAGDGLPRPCAPSPAQMTRAALRVLSRNPNGFFLMVEGGQIDWAGHINDAADAIAETIAFDEAVAVGRQFAATRGDTLVIVTADHETGGMTLHLAPTGEPDEAGPFFMPEGTPFYITWTTLGHTPVDVPTTAEGPGSHLLRGHYDNTHIFHVMRRAIDRGESRHAASAFEAAAS